jgi:hypothetical protein
MVGGATLIVGGFLLVPAHAGASPRTEAVALTAMAPHTQSHGKHGIIGVGSTWTLYDGDLAGLSGLCEVFTFETKTTFSGDLGDTGRWSKQVTLTFDTTGSGPFGIYDPGLVYKMKYFSAFTAFNGAGTQGSEVAGGADLAAGFDPFGLGSC